MPASSHSDNNTIDNIRIYEKPNLYQNYQPIYYPLAHVKRVTVCFGSTKIVVPCKGSFTVRDLAEGALTRYKRATGRQNDKNLRIVRLECASDGGVLDQEDRLDDVFEWAYDQILAIYDEGNGPQGGSGMNTSADYAQPLPLAARQRARGQEDHFTHSAVRSSSSSAYSSNAPLASPYATSPLHTIKRPDTSVVEVSTLDRPSALKVFTASHERGRQWRSEEPTEEERPTIVVDARNGTVTTTANFSGAPQPPIHHYQRKSSSSLSSSKGSVKPMRSSLRSQTVSEQQTPAKQKPQRVTLSPEVEKRLKEKDTETSSKFARGSDRKSRLTDAFFDAREKLQNEESEMEKPIPVKPKMKGSVKRGADPSVSVLTLAWDDPRTPEEAEVGLEVAAVFDEVDGGKLTSVQILRIEPGTRAKRDGRLKVGDCIVEIDGRPVYQMSILRARAHLADLALARRDVSLTIARSLETFIDQEAEENAANDKKPILSALQQANSMSIGDTTTVELTKGSNGFGFTVTGRETSKGERLFYIGTVKPYGVAIGHLKSGDRLLEVNGASVGGLAQLEIVDILKKTPVGSSVSFLISRVAVNSSPTKEEEAQENKENKSEPQATTVEKPAAESPIPEAPFDLIIPLNDTGSAGLGISLKARVSVKRDGSRHDCGIFIKNIMHGGAAFKDGQLRVNDRIVGIEDINLEHLQNTEAGEAISKKLKSIGANYSHVRLKIFREPPATSEAGRLAGTSSRITVDAPSPAPSSMISHSVLPSPLSGCGTSSAGSTEHSRQPSANLERPQQLDESDLPPPNVDPFDREAPTRKSLSEKRGLGAPNDPQRIRLFQNIKHQRQTSAPPPSSSTTKGRSRSQPRFASHRVSKVEVTRDSAESPTQNDLDADEPILASGGLLNRKSLSMESINRTVGSTVLRRVEPPMSRVPPIPQEDSSHPYPPGSPILRPKSVERARDKQRRKSVGSMMRNIFGFGGNSKSRDASPEKTSWELRKGSWKERARREASLDPNLMRHGGYLQEEDYAEPKQYRDYISNMDYGDSYYLPQHHYQGMYERYEAHRYGGGGGAGGRAETDGAAADAGQKTAKRTVSSPPTYVSYQIPGCTSANGGSIGSSTTLRRRMAGRQPYENGLYACGDYLGDDYSPVLQRRAQEDYYNMFNSWFSYTGGGAAPGKSSYNSPVRIAAASSALGGGGHGRAWAPPSSSPPAPPSTRPPTSVSTSSAGASTSKKYAAAGANGRVLVQRGAGPAPDGGHWADGAAAAAAGYYSPATKRQQQQLRLPYN